MRRSLESQSRPRRHSSPSRNLAQIAKAIRDKNPDQLRLPGFLWTRALVCELIERRLGIRVGEKTAGRYLRAWGFSPQKPARRAFERNPELVARWLDQRYPALERRAYRERALILWADEMGLRSDHSAGRSWAPVGQTPIVAGTGQRFGANVISAISNKGRLQFSVFKQRFTAAVMIDFLTRLIRQADGQKIILILDGHPVHRATKVRQWVAAHAEQIELQLLPGYSRELNPTELLNQDVKTNALGRRRPRSQDELTATPVPTCAPPNTDRDSSPATSKANTSATHEQHDGYLPAPSSNAPHASFKHRRDLNEHEDARKRLDWNEIEDVHRPGVSHRRAGHRATSSPFMR